VIHARVVSRGFYGGGGFFLLLNQPSNQSHIDPPLPLPQLALKPSIQLTRSAASSSPHSLLSFLSESTTVEIVIAEVEKGCRMRLIKQMSKSDVLLLSKDEFPETEKKTSIP